MAHLWRIRKSCNIHYPKKTIKRIRIVPSQVWEDEKGVDAAVLASAQHVSSFDAIPGLSLASRLVLGLVQ